jgi:hypothetical protein
MSQSEGSVCFCTEYACDKCGCTDHPNGVFVYDTPTIEADLLDGTRRVRGIQLCEKCDVEFTNICEGTDGNDNDLRGG